MSEKVQCPNCLGEAEKTGNKITCIACDATFEIKKTGAASVVKLGEFEQLKGRVGALETLLAPEPHLPPGPDTEPEKEIELEEEDILPL